MNGIWEVDVAARPGLPDRRAQSLAQEAAQLGLVDDLSVRSAHGYLLEGALDASQARAVAARLLCDTVVETFQLAPIGDPALVAPREAHDQVVYVLPKPGVMDPVAQSVQAALAGEGFFARVRTFRKYWFRELDGETLRRLCQRCLANDAIEQVVIGPLGMEHLSLGSTYDFARVEVPLAGLSDMELVALSRRGQLSLTLDELHTIQRHFAELRRAPTDVELETIAQTWSEHCSHKTLKGRIRYRDPGGEHEFANLLRETIFAATDQLRQRWGTDDWCVSVFEDNAGIVRFDDDYHVVFKVETHNHPSALEPYGGANTGLGGVIRDALGTGLGAKPVCNTDVFCFAPPDTPAASLPPGVLHPRRVMRGVVSGVRDYGNRMGIPTVNGAVYFDPRYLGNPLVYCGTVGLLPRDKAKKAARPGDLIVAIGGRTGRDGIHGATFSSIELTSASETLSGGAVQIGNAITEKMLLDVLLEARDRGLYHAVTDCGAGGFSSAVGEMGETVGAEVWLERVPLKYDGLSYTEIWISEAQERMVLAVPPGCWEAFHALAASEDVEATVIGQFVATGRLTIKYQDAVVGDLSMKFLHDGRPPVVREATYRPAAAAPLATPTNEDFSQTLRAILASLNVASKESIIRQYDHEVQGGSVLKPLVGAANDGPGDAAVLRPVLTSRRGLVVACGMNPRYGDFDTYAMAASAIDEAARNCVAVGADPRRIALLDNFCWGNTARPETLGSLVRAALACRDLALVLEMPFISGKDSLNNEFSYESASGERTTVVIPPSLLISALGQIDDVSLAVSMDLKQPGNLLYQVGLTRAELGGSHWSAVHAQNGGRVPTVDPVAARRTFLALHAAIAAGLVRACHDLSEGGMAVAAAEMAFAGELGLELDLAAVPRGAADDDSPSEPSLPMETIVLFSESNSRFLCEVPPHHAAAFEATLSGIPHARLGQVTGDNHLRVRHGERLLFEAPLAALKAAWQSPLAEPHSEQ